MVIPVSLDVAAPGGTGVTWRLAGDLFLPPGDQPDTVQLLLAGLTYDRRYWTAPGDTGYVRHMAAEGHAVLALDRIGTGDSDHPPADQVTVRANVETVHQVIQSLRTGLPGVRPFRRVAGVGHSLGSGIAIIEAALHRDFDALVLTGLSHARGPLYPQAVSSLHPAIDDEQFAGLRLPDGYLTTRPGRRALIYEHAGGVEPALSEYHERTKSTVTIGEGATVDIIYQRDYAAAVEVPVLLVIGREDRLFGGGELSCEDAGTVADFERGFYSQAASLGVLIVPEAAHSLNIHRTARLWYAATTSWLGQAVHTASA